MYNKKDYIINRFKKRTKNILNIDYKELMIYDYIVS